MLHRGLPPAVRSLLAFAGALLVLWTFLSMGGRLMGGFVLDLGRSINQPTPLYGRFLGLWMLFGTLAAACFAVGFAGLRLRSPFELVAGSPRLRAAISIVVGGVVAVAVPAAIRIWLLDGMPLTDDEAAYRLATELLAGGRLSIESPPAKLFFDNRFLINDGRLYPAYFLGWPALQVPGVWLGLPGFMNALYAGLTVVPLVLVLRRLLGDGWALVGALLYVLSPMLMIGAATELSHTTCVMALAWLTWLAVRARDGDAPSWSHAGMAIAFSVAFFVRPAPAVAVGGPLLVWWALSVVRRPDARRRAAVAAFLVPALLGAGLFLLVNSLQNGSPFVTGYQRSAEYAEQTGYRFSEVSPPLPAAPLERLRHVLAVSGAALFRFNTDLFGWPFSLLFVPFARRAGLWTVLFVSAAFHLLLHAFLLPDVGVDSFAPMHFFEMAWPLLLLTVAGVANLTSTARAVEDWVGRRAPGAPSDPVLAIRRWPLAAVAGLALATSIGFLPVRLGALERVARNIAVPFDRAESAGLEEAVVFAPVPFVEYCRGPERGWVFSRPNNGPGLDDDPLWVNHLGIEADRRFMSLFPERRGWVMVWTEACDVAFLPLDRLDPGDAPDPVRGSAGVADERREAARPRSISR